MQLNSRHSRRHHSDPYTTFVVPYPAALSAYIPDMYSTQRLEVPSDITMQRMFSTKSTLKGESNMSQMQSPKKENMLQSVLTAFTSFFWEQSSKVSSSYMANLNNPLSVTVVQNEGIISHEFFKSLTTRKEQLTTDNMYIHNMPTKESLNIVNKSPLDAFHKDISFINGDFNKSVNETFKFHNKHKETIDDQIIERSDKNEPSMKDNTDEHIGDSKIQTDNALEGTLVQCNNYSTEDKREQFTRICSSIARKMHATKHFHDCANSSANDIFNDKQTLDLVDASMDTKSFIDDEYAVIFSPEDEEEQIEDSTKQTVISNFFSSMWHKVVDGVTDRLYFKTESTMPVASIKRSASPKQRRKLNTVAKGRGRGRAKSQLRRSGVSQTRHRKERTKHDLIVDIQDDFESWQDFEIYHTVKNNELVDYCSLDENDVDVPDAPEFLIHESACPITFTFADVKPRNRKPKTRKIIDQDVSNFPTRVRYVPECTTDTDAFQQDYDIKYDLQVNQFRPRLISESSADSEDSYCIVFETGSETNYKNDLDIDEGSDDVQSTDGEESEPPMQKVKFNLKPVVHVMIQWDYAYRAARRGPWEEMARDRERFRGRINCIERVLNPILTKQHRTHIWQERFALQE